MTQIIGIAIFVLIFMGILIKSISTYNKLIMLKNNVSKSFANIDVLLKQRADEIPNIITIIKEATNYESETLKKLTMLRTNYRQTNDVNEKIDIDKEMTQGLRNLLALSENYPQLRANESFLTLQTRISHIEDMIANRREFYNDSVNIYNIGITEFPNFLFAGILGYKKINLLQITETEKEYNGVKF